MSEEQRIKTYKGKISAGLGKSGFYLEKLKPVYRKFINMDYFCGTLNIHADKNLAIPKNAIYIPGDIYGGAYFIPATLFNEHIFIVRPEKTKHPSYILEIIATKNLREKYKLKNGDSITIKTFE